MKKNLTFLKFVLATEQGGNLRIEAKEETTICNGRTKHYTSGQAISPFSLAYGYFEIRAKIPNGDGLWPAFWFWSGCGSNAYSEIDVFEFCGCNCGVNPRPTASCLVFSV